MNSYPPVTVIGIHAWGKRVGAVAFDPNVSCYAFGYDPDWASGNVQLSPLVMPNRRAPYVFPGLARHTFYGLPGMLADALPDAFGNAVINAWLASEGIAKEDFSSLDRLAYAGNRAIGALNFQPETPIPDLPPTAVALADVVQAAREVITGSVKTTGMLSGTLAQLISIGSSAGGARAKAIVEFNPNTMQVWPRGVTAAGFRPAILKLDGVATAADGSVNTLDEPEQFTRIEYAYYLMAGAAGVNMFPSQLLLEGPRAHFLTERFDRAEDGTPLHVQSLCAIAHLDFRMANAHSYEQYFNTIRQLELGTEALAQAFRRMVFNVAAVNRDDHTKNFAFLCTHEGRWSLAPAFDVTHSYNPKGEWTQRHQMSINGKFENISLADLTITADRYGVPGYKDVITEIVTVTDNWKQFANQAGVAETETHRIEGHIGTFSPR